MAVSKSLQTMFGINYRYEICVFDFQRGRLSSQRLKRKSYLTYEARQDHFLTLLSKVHSRLVVYQFNLEDWNMRRLYLVQFLAFTPEYVLYEESHSCRQTYFGKLAGVSAAWV